MITLAALLQINWKAERWKHKDQLWDWVSQGERQWCLGSGGRTLRIIDTGCISKVELTELADILDVCQEKRVVKVNFEVLRLTRWGNYTSSRLGWRMGSVLWKSRGSLWDVLHLRCLLDIQVEILSRPVDIWVQGRSLSWR